MRWTSTRLGLFAGVLSLVLCSIDAHAETLREGSGSRAIEIESRTPFGEGHVLVEKYRYEIGYELRYWEPIPSSKDLKGQLPPANRSSRVDTSKAVSRLEAVTLQKKAEAYASNSPDATGEKATRHIWERNHRLAHIDAVARATNDALGRMVDGRYGDVQSRSAAATNRFREDLVAAKSHPDAPDGSTRGIGAIRQARLAEAGTDSRAIQDYIATKAAEALRRRVVIVSAYRAGDGESTHRLGALDIRTRPGFLAALKEAAGVSGALGPNFIVILEVPTGGKGSRQYNFAFTAGQQGALAIGIRGERDKKTGARFRAEGVHLHIAPRRGPHYARALGVARTWEKERPPGESAPDVERGVHIDAEWPRFGVVPNRVPRGAVRSEGLFHRLQKADEYWSKRYAAQDQRKDEIQKNAEIDARKQLEQEARDRRYMNNLNRSPRKPYEGPGGGRGTL